MWTPSDTFNIRRTLYDFFLFVVKINFMIAENERKKSIAFHKKDGNLAVCAYFVVVNIRRGKTTHIYFILIDIDKATQRR